MTRATPLAGRAGDVPGGTARPPRPWLPRGLTLPGGRLLVMGILNVTPDSFSDGGRWDDTGAALAHAEEMLEEGADLIDVGGESTRPGSRRLSPEEEWGRIGDVVARLADQGVVVSVDTLHADTARRSADAGAALINDVSGGRADPGMNAAVAASSCAYVVQHWRGFPGAPDEDFDYGDVVADVLAETSAQVRGALDAGVPDHRIVVDPGLGFSLRPEQSWRIVEHMSRLRDLGYPVLIGASRKRFLREGAEVDREAATLTITRNAARAGMWAVRVHEVGPNAQAARATRTGVEGGQG